MLATLLPVLNNPAKQKQEMTVLPALMGAEAVLDRADDYERALESIKTDGVKEAVENI